MLYSLCKLLKIVIKVLLSKENFKKKPYLALQSYNGFLVTERKETSNDFIPKAARTVDLQSATKYGSNGEQKLSEL